MKNITTSITDNIGNQANSKEKFYHDCAVLYNIVTTHREIFPSLWWQYLTGITA